METSSGVCAVAIILFKRQRKIEINEEDAFSLLLGSFAGEMKHIRLKERTVQSAW